MVAPFEPEQHVVALDETVGLESAFQVYEVDRAVMLMDLNGVASAEGDLRTGRSGKMGKLPQSANGAAFAGFGG